MHVKMVNQPFSTQHQRRLESPTAMEDDVYLPWHTRPEPELTRTAQLTASEGDPEPLRNGLDRPIGAVDNGWRGNPGAWVQYTFEKPEIVSSLRFVFDSELNRPGETMAFHYPLDMEPAGVPKTLLRSFAIQAMDAENRWSTVFQEQNNYQRLRRYTINQEIKALRFVPEQTWGADQFHLFAWDVR